MSKKKTEVTEPVFDEDLLVDVLSQQSSMTDDTAMMLYLKAKIEEYGQTWEEDAYGNLYVTKGEASLYPCLVSHTDQVHQIHEKYAIFEVDRLLFAFDSKEGEQVGIGGDDLCGVSICLNALKDLPAVKIVFFRFEETGCKGSRQAEMSFFDNCNIVLQPDRRGNGDFITNAVGVELSSVEFQKDIAEILDRHHYTITRGSTTDVMALKEKGLDVCACNISCGYWAPHSDKEVVTIDDVADCYDTLVEIIDRCKGIKYSHIYRRPEVHVVNPTSRRDERDVLKTGSVQQLNIPFEASPYGINPKMTHHMTPIVDVEGDDENIEEYLEEIDIAIGDLRSTVEDYIEARMRSKEFSGRI